MDEDADEVRPLRVVITNAVLTNTGDAAILDGIVTSLDREFGPSELIVTVHDWNAKVSARLYPEWKIDQQPTFAARSRGRIQRYVGQMLRDLTVNELLKRRRAREAANSVVGRRLLHWLGLGSIMNLADADVVISSGGTYLVDHYDFSRRISELALAKAYGSAVMLWTQSMGPFVTGKSAKQIRRLDQVADAVFFRDEKSRAAWERMLPLPKVSAVVPDVAFALFDEECLNPGRGAVDRVGISVREWHQAVGEGDFDYEPFAVELAELVESERDIEWTAISTCQGVPEYDIDDSQTAARIFRGLDVTVDQAHRTPRALVRELTTFHAVITMRMHLAILALITRTPVYAIAYEFKTTELFNDLGLAGDTIPIEAADAGTIRQQLRVLLGGEGAQPLPLDVLRGLSDRASSPARAIRDLVVCD